MLRLSPFLLKRNLRCLAKSPPCCTPAARGRSARVYPRLSLRQGGITSLLGPVDHRPVVERTRPRDVGVGGLHRTWAVDVCLGFLLFAVFHMTERRVGSGGF